MPARIHEDIRINQINKLPNIEFLRWADGYKNQKSKAVVRCSIDGYEWQSSVNNLVDGRWGCPRCSGKEKYTQEQRISQITNAGTGRYEFVGWSSSYKNGNSKVIVRCLIDQFEWSTRVDALVLIGTGCPKCSKSGYNRGMTGYIYALRSECGRYVKVGITNNPSRRISKLERSTPFKFNAVEIISGNGCDVLRMETSIHRKYESANKTGFDGATEWLMYDNRIIDEIKSGLISL